MKFLLDENVDLPLAGYLSDRGYDVTAIASDYTRSVGDDEVLELARNEHRILITSDKDFGALIYQEGLPHTGVILFRLRDEAIPFKLARLEAVLTQHADALADGAYVVVTDRRIRVRHMQSDDEAEERF
jgi:predicted nuclease of predicted toxin-antitoxin system